MVDIGDKVPLFSGLVGGSDHQLSLRLPPFKIVPPVEEIRARIKIAWGQARKKQEQRMTNEDKALSLSPVCLFDLLGLNWAWQMPH